MRKITACDVGAVGQENLIKLHMSMGKDKNPIGKELIMAILDENAIKNIARDILHESK